MDTFDELQFELGVALCCGKCEESVRDVMAQSGVCASRCGVEHVAPLTFYERQAA
ncbi:hypothetical protein CBA19CS22_01835 [Caballeronia novacaledonica]|uniref:Uncharacterized protein n=1 Tax=Caballeronia novacaledonica TaxID=1544861 RepID=A0ACB5QJ85_9BURK|nr:hypothetical protein CBA19CS22_01835 [Caballeronia novacaledonica]